MSGRFRPIHCGIVVPPESPIVLVVAGPTASGKTSLALFLARSLGAEIVNCDSLQVYRGMDIGTAKPSREERAQVPHHLFDILEPADVFNAGDYAARARRVIIEISSRGRLPLLAGGTGFYLRSLFEGLAAGPQRNERLRSRLQSAADRRPAFLHRLLRRLDPLTAARIHSNDRNKLVRAIEICILARRPASAVFEEGRLSFDGVRALKLVLNPPRVELLRRITERTRRMFESGLLDEVSALLNSGIPVTTKALESIGYQQACKVLAGQMTQAEAIESVTIATRQYAKRQITWFRREKDVEWLYGFGDSPEVQETAILRCRRFLD